LTEDASARGETEDSDTGVSDEKKNTARDAAVDGFVAALAAAVERRVALSVADAPRGNGTSDPPDGRAFIGVLFSGGVDSMLLAALAHRHVPPGRAVDLINVCFDGGRSPDRAAALDGAAELEALFPARAWRLVRVDADVDEVRRGLPAARLAGLLRPARTVMDRNIGAALWLAAKGEGWVDVASAPAANSRPGCSPNSLARSRAAAGVRVPYASRARVLLLGQGADEQCAGYSRHRAAFRAGASSGEAIRASEKEEGPAEGLSPARDWEALGDAVRLDATRLWRRNMGRDDRLVSDRGREARFPFLDEGVAARLLATPLCDVADLSGHAGGGQAARPRRRAPARHAPRGGARQARHSIRVARLEKV
jgi:asparagine synthetase B (glutamine-hydrolysing)